MEHMNRQKSTFRISFYVRRTRPNKHGEVPVCVRITVNGQRADTTIRKSILPEQWDAIRGQTSPHTTLGKAINLYIDTVRARIIRIQRDDLYLNEVDRRFVEESEFYLRTHRGCSHNTATKDLKNFKKITRIALAREWMQRAPFAKVLDPTILREMSKLPEKF